MTLLPIRSCWICFSLLLFALSVAYLSGSPLYLTSGPPADWVATRHERLDEFDEGFLSGRQRESTFGRTLFQAQQTGSAGTTADETGGGEAKAAASQASSGQASGGDSRSEDASYTPGCKMPAAVKPRRAGATTMKPSAQKCSTACRWQPDDASKLFPATS